MTDTSKKTVEQEVCNPISKTMHNAPAMLAVVRTLVKERDVMANALAFIASRGEDLSKDAIETIARQALKNIGE